MGGRARGTTIHGLSSPAHRVILGCTSSSVGYLERNTLAPVPRTQPSPAERPDVTRAPPPGSREARSFHHSGHGSSAIMR